RAGKDCGRDEAVPGSGAHGNVPAETANGRAREAGSRGAGHDPRGAGCHLAGGGPGDAASAIFEESTMAVRLMVPRADVRRGSINLCASVGLDLESISPNAS